MENTARKLSIPQADRLDIQYWKTRSPEDKLDVLQHLRDEYYKFKNENRKGLQRVYRIIK